MINVANRVGWKQEGLLKDSFYSKSGAMKNQYIFGITRKDFACQTHGTQCAKATS
jgi:RimJ/RimL family protein N-acetyltransferase